MRFHIALGIFFVIVGVFGALRSSAVLFGLFTTGLFLIFSDLRVNGKHASTATSPVFASLTCPECQFVLKGEMTFCPQCGRKIRME